MLTYLILGVAGPVFAQSEQQEQDSPFMKAAKEVQWTVGPSIAKLGSIAEIKLPIGMRAVKGDDARRISEAMQNPTASRDFSLIFPDSGDWYARFQFEEIGLVKDDEKGSLDPNAILESIRQGTETANKERAKRGWAPVIVVGWEQPPHYDEQTHNLTWAVRGESRGELSINYDTRLLGRKGVMRVKLVTAPQTLPQALSEFRTLLAGFNYTKGNRYAEWVPGDKVAQVGLTALVTGVMGDVGSETTSGAGLPGTSSRPCATARWCPSVPQDIVRRRAPKAAQP
jgi:uncharacterized membrane-anchored protein